MNYPILPSALCLVLISSAGLRPIDARAKEPQPAAVSERLIPDRPEKLSYPPLKFEPPDPADFRVQLQNGPVAYVLPDRELPLVTVSVYVRVGQYLVPAGKEGLGELAGYLLARGGTATDTADELEERLDYLAAQLNSGIGEFQGTVSLNLLSKDLGEGLQILREVLSAPRFQEDKIALRKQQLLQEMQQRNDDSANIEARERRFLAYGESFWINRHPTARSVESISRADLRAFHQRWFDPTNFVVAANGDFERQDMVRRLENLFKDWPFHGEPSPPVPTNTVFAAAGAYLIDKDVNQGRVTIILPGIQRDDPNYFAVSIMNDILGGGGFTSRMVNRVRSEEGLAYSAGSSFPGGVYFPVTFTASFQSKSRTVAYATGLLLDEIKHMAAEPPSDEELNTSKRSFIETFPQTFATKGQTARIFADDELTGRFARNPQFWRTYRANVEAVGKDDVQRVARNYLIPEKLVVLVVGQKNDILQGTPDHPGTLESITGSPVHELPLRDPLTMQPLARP